jgi:hypothetical protein
MTPLSSSSGKSMTDRTLPPSLTEDDFVKARYVVTPSRNGWAAVWLVDDDGCQLHTEPVCTFPDDWHPWFGTWIEKQDVPVKMLSRLDCPAHKIGKSAKHAL